ncbi:hypothetical protein DSL72_009501 [Monilinia vaccinii-corymbosi]|uniref:Uncharacterized protein n=1 Tax=Monilinia vaccinii-corymbosi TaxID=61207 RepID=A0A8A3PQX1_9HELO|nr:hypothetical protein DSL72_009501 [Monilinia vaccinii-corymbosi]
MSPPPSLYPYPEREHEHRRTRTRTHHDPSDRSPSMTSTLRPPPGNTSVDSLGKPQLATQTQHRPHRSRHSRPSPQSMATHNQATSRPRSSSAFPSPTSHLHSSPPHAASSGSPATFSRASTLIPTHAPPPPMAVEFLNFLDDLGVLVLCRPLLELCNVEWLTLFDDMGIFYLCEPMSFIRRLLKKLKMGAPDKERDAGGSVGSKSTWEGDTVSWLSSVESAIKGRRDGKGGSKRHSGSGGGGENPNVTRKSRKEVDGSASEMGSERMSGASRRRDERAANGLGQDIRGAPRAKL